MKYVWKTGWDCHQEDGYFPYVEKQWYLNKNVRYTGFPILESSGAWIRSFGEHDYVLLLLVEAVTMTGDNVVERREIGWTEVSEASSFEELEEKLEILDRLPEFSTISAWG